MPATRRAGDIALVAGDAGSLRVAMGHLEPAHRLQVVAIEPAWMDDAEPGVQIAHAGLSVEHALVDQFAHRGAYDVAVHPQIRASVISSEKSPPFRHFGSLIIAHPSCATRA